MANRITLGIDTSSGSQGPVSESDTLLDIATLARSSSGAVALYTDASTTSIVLGGGTNQTTVTIGKASQNTTVNGNLVVSGDLTVNGTSTTISTTNLSIEDVLIILASTATTGNEAGVAFERGSTGDDSLLLWNEVNDRFEVGFYDTSGGTVVPTGALTSLSDLRCKDLDVGSAVAATTGTLSIGSNSSGNRGAYLELYSDDTYSPGAAFRRLAGVNAGANLFTRGTGTFTIKTEEAGEIQLQTTATRRLTIASDGKVGIGPAAPGSVGPAKLEVNGTASSNAGPHVNFIVSGSTYPVMQIMPWGHDNAAILFDTYYDSGWLSADTGSNFWIRKIDDVLRILRSSGNSLGASVTWVNAQTIDVTGAITLNAGSETLSLDGNAIETSSTTFTADAALTVSSGSTDDNLTLATGNNGAGASGDISIDVGTASTTAGTISIGTTNASAITIGNNTGTTSVALESGSGGINMDGDGNSAWAIAGTLDIDSTSDLSINSSAAPINIGNDAVNQNINIATGGARTVTIGGTSAASVYLRNGTGGTIGIGDTAYARTVNVGTGAAIQTVTIGSTTTSSSMTIDAGTGGIDIGTGTAAMTVNLGTGGTGAKTVNIGDESVSTSSVTIEAGSSADITFDARGITSPITLNQSGDVNLDGGFTATSIIGALNELKTSPAAATLANTLSAGNTTGGTDIVVSSGDVITAPAGISLTVETAANTSATGSIIVQAGASSSGNGGDASLIAGDGTAASGGDVEIKSGTGNGSNHGVIRFSTGGTEKWFILGSSLYATTDATSDIGFSTDYRPNNVYVYSSVRVGSTSAVTIARNGITGATGQGFSIDAGAGSGATTGGSIGLTAGAGGSSGNPGTVGLTGGAAGGGSNDAGGAVTIYTGAGDGSGAGGTLSLYGGNGGATGQGGGLYFEAGDGGVTSGAGGSAIIKGGPSWTGDGGSASMTGGNALTSGAGGSVGMAAGNASGTNKAGGSVSISAGDSTTSTTGGAVTVTAGTSVSNGDGGAVTITAGSGGSANGTGGAISLTGGASPNGTAGGAVAITGGAHGSAGTGGQVRIYGGDGGTTSGTGGAVLARGGLSTDGDGGYVSITGGYATGTNRTGGQILLYAGNSTGTATGGSAVLSGATGGATGAGGSCTVQAGAGGSSSGNGGELILAGGTVTSGTAGSITIKTNNSTRWTVNASGHLLAGTDDSYDIGASGATRPRSVYIGSSINVGDSAGVSATGSATFGDGTNKIAYTPSGNTLKSTGSWTAWTIDCASRSGSGMNLSLTAGASSSGAGGSNYITGGAGTTSGGSVIITGGAGSANNGGSITIYGGATTTGTGGHLYLRGGNSTGGTDGSITIGDANTTAVNIVTGSATGTVSVGNSSAGAISINAGSNDLTLAARSGSVTLNQSGSTSLSGFTATSIVGALNELKGPAGVNNLSVLGSATGIDAKSTGLTGVVSVPSGKTAIITGVAVYCTAASGITVPASASVGTVAGGYVDVFDDTPFSGLTASGDIYQYASEGGPVGVVGASTTAYLYIQTAATGTSQTLSAYVLGFLV